MDYQYQCFHFHRIQLKGIACIRILYRKILNSKLNQPDRSAYAQRLKCFADCLINEENSIFDAINTKNDHIFTFV